MEKIKVELDWDFYQLEQKHVWHEYEKIGHQITQKLEKYSTHPGVKTNALVWMHPRVLGEPVKFRKLYPERGAYFWVTHPSSAWGWGEDPYAFFALQEIVKRGWVGRLRICDVCKKWFCARKEFQLYCTNGRCRQRKYEASPEYKKWRRKNEAVHKRLNTRKAK